MMHSMRLWLVVAAFAVIGPRCALLSCQGADGWAPVTPSAVAEEPPVSASGTVEHVPTPAPTPDSPLPYVLPAPPNYSADGEGWIHSPLLDRAEAPTPGFFFNAESSLLWPHLSARLVGGIANTSNVGGQPIGGLPITGDLVRFPNNSLNPTVSPRFDFGYRLPDGFGEIRFSYRFMDSRGADTVVVAPPNAYDNLGPASQTGRLAMNIFDLDFGTRQFSLGPNWPIYTAVGARYATAYLDSQVTFLNPTTVTGSPFGTIPFTRLWQTEVLFNHYIGAHAVFEIDRKLPLDGLATFLRLDGAGMYARAHQTFKETFAQSPGFTQYTAANGVGTPVLAVQIGLTYDIPRWNYARLMIGYQYEEWWQFGRGDDDLSMGNFKDQGLFLRFECNF